MKRILIIDPTGAKGGSVERQLLNSKLFHVRCMVPSQKQEKGKVFASDQHLTGLI